MRKYTLLIASWLLLSCNQDNAKGSTKPELTHITELVYAFVIIKPRHSYFAQSARSGIIEEIFVEVGDTVEKGQRLARISASADVINSVTHAEINLKEAKEKYLGENNVLLNVEWELKSLREQLALDSLNYSRQKKLWTQNIGKKTDLEQAELAYITTRNKYEILLKKKEQNINELENQYQKAFGQVKAEQTQLADFTLRSAYGGIAYSINKEEGEFIGSQDLFAEIGSSDNFVVEMDIDEADITKINISDTVLITLDAYANEVFIAQVSKVLFKKDEMTQTFRVECIFLKQPPKLYYGLSGEANIVVDKRENAMVIPSEYLIQGNTVLTNEGEKSVKPGVKNMKFVEIRSGIDTSTILLQPKEE